MDLNKKVKELEALKERNQEMVAMRKVLMGKLKSDYGIESIEDGKEQLKELIQERDKMIKEFEDECRILEREIEESNILS